MHQKSKLVCFVGFVLEKVFHQQRNDDLLTESSVTKKVDGRCFTRDAGIGARRCLA